MDGWLPPLILIGNTQAEFRQTTDAILEPMNFGFFYDPCESHEPGRPSGTAPGRVLAR